MERDNKAFFIRLSSDLFYDSSKVLKINSIIRV